MSKNILSNIEKDYEIMLNDGIEDNQIITLLNEKYKGNSELLEDFYDKEGLEYLKEEEKPISEDDLKKKHKFEDSELYLDGGKNVLDRFSDVDRQVLVLRKTLQGRILEGNKWVKKYRAFASTFIIDEICQHVSSLLPSYGIISKQGDEFNFVLQISMLDIIDILEDSPGIDVHRFMTLKNVVQQTFIQIRGMVTNGNGADFFSGNITGNYEPRNEGEKNSKFELTSDGKTLARL